VNHPFVLAVALALAASLAYGASDFYAGVLARRLPTVLIAMWSQVLGLLTLGAAAALSGQPFDGDGFAWGLAAGVVGAVGLLAFYRALEIGPASVVAPVSALGVLVAVAVAAVRGEAPGIVGLLGIPLAVAGLALVASANAEDDRPETQPCAGPRAVLGPGRRASESAGEPGRRAAIPLALGAALGFGVFFVLLEEGTTAAPAAELWVVFGVLVAALPTTVAAAVREMESLRLARVLAPVAIVALFDLAGDASLTFASAEGDLATVGVLASLDPVVTVLLAIVLLRERLPTRQAVGVAGCLAGVVLVAAG
jgi:drug/metabolite transporter (DMT)-like permease